MRISIVAAMGANRAIGLGNGLPWRMPADLKYFKSLTMGHHLIMGRKTFDTVGKPLPGRPTIVVSRQRSLGIDGVTVANSLDQALNLVKEVEEVFIAGGAEIYRLALDVADRIYLTLIHHSFDADTFFPTFDESKWQVVSRTDCEADEKNPYAYSFLIFDRAS